MSSRLTPPSARTNPNPNSKHLPYPVAPASRRHATAAAPFLPPGSHVLPPSSVLAESANTLERLSHPQPVHGLRSAPLRLEPLDLSNAYRPWSSSSPPPPVLPPLRRTSQAGAAPLEQLLHPVSSQRWEPQYPQYPQSPSSSYSSQSERSAYGGASFRTAPQLSPTEYGNYRSRPSATTSSGPYRYIPPAANTRAAAAIHVPAAVEPVAKVANVPDMWVTSETARPGSTHANDSSIGKSTDRYNLTIRQQPLAARACGFGERDRRVIDPPPIVQLSLTDFDPLSTTDVSELRWPFNVVHCALLSVSSAAPAASAASAELSDADVTTVTDPNDANKLSRRLMGTLVASPFIGTDPDAPASPHPNARLGCFFIFPDLSCRQNGCYRLRFTLMKVNVELTPTGGQSSIVGAVESDVFEVFSAKDFPGMRASTRLTKELKMQGAAVSVKKGNESKAGKKAKRRGGGTTTATTTTADPTTTPAPTPAPTPTTTTTTTMTTATASRSDSKSDSSSTSENNSDSGTGAGAIADRRRKAKKRLKD